MISKEKKMQVLNTFIQQKGSCAFVDCGECMNALYDLPLGSCPGHNKSIRLETAKRRLYELTSALDSNLIFHKDEEQIVLNQSL